MYNGRLVKNCNMTLCKEHCVRAKCVGEMIPQVFSKVFRSSLLIFYDCVNNHSDLDTKSKIALLKLS